MNILVTGGTGYIGSHTVVALSQAGHDVTIIDNLSNSSNNVLSRLEQLCERSIPFFQIDLLNTQALTNLFQANSFDAVIHFAGLKSVAESVAKPLDYYQNNVNGTLNLLEVMAHTSVFKLVFSSSATVYGSAPIPYEEDGPAGNAIASPYGRAKYIVEQILQDVAGADSRWSIASLRYFNPLGAHSSGLIGEQPRGVPNNLMPFITQVAAGQRNQLSIYGGDYNTIDGTCVRDYIHIEDLAEGHVNTLEHLQSGHDVINLGSGKGVSVLELIRTFERVNNIPIPYAITGNRPGDLPSFYASSHKASRVLNWQPKRSLEDMCRDAWNWQTKNPNGYEIV